MITDEFTFDFDLERGTLFLEPIGLEIGKHVPELEIRKAIKDFKESDSYHVDGSERYRDVRYSFSATDKSGIRFDIWMRLYGIPKIQLPTLQGIALNGHFNHDYSDLYDFIDSKYKLNNKWMKTHFGSHPKIVREWGEIENEVNIKAENAFISIEWY